ncbi:MAG: hypothetical protein FJ344_05950 [Sphingomonadales bacterium]|nr:hypothetical protein [Sphingomonadales bacterium]
MIHLLSEAGNLLGRLLGNTVYVGFELREEAVLEILSMDVINPRACPAKGLSAGR